LLGEALQAERDDVARVEIEAALEDEQRPLDGAGVVQDPIAWLAGPWRSSRR